MLDQTQGPRRKIAVIGAGISGLSSAYHLSAYHDVTLFESASRVGGHARTVIAGKNNDQPVDTGFIVFNYATYPNLTRLFQELDVPVIKSEMSFGASIDFGSLEYGLKGFKSIFAQKRNILRPQFYKMFLDIIRFGNRAEQAATDDDKTIGELVDELGLGQWFRDKYLLPMCGAIWSTPATDVDAFPAKSLVQFFRNHALLSGKGQHQWWTVKGGSIEYVRRLEAAIVARGCDIRLNAPVKEVKRHDRGVTIQTEAEINEFDQVIFACHSDQAKNILGENATPIEKSALESIRYQPNTAVLHRDETQMQKRRDCWASWVYKSDNGATSVTYWMNQLQSIPESDPLFVTINPSSEIATDKIYDTTEFAHPVFDKAALRAQKTIREIQGQNRTWFVGAYNRHGFHEDGIASAMRVVRVLNSSSYVTGADNAFDKQSA
jgi:predicted NAD/FAD-binding protein